jgi:hypothetical protein
VRSVPNRSWRDRREAVFFCAISASSTWSTRAACSANELGKAGESHYVTYEWAYALGKGKSIIPMKLGACAAHPKLESIQYLNFANPGLLPWATLINRIHEIVFDHAPTQRAYCLFGHGDASVLSEGCSSSYLKTGRNRDWPRRPQPVIAPCVYDGIEPQMVAFPYWSEKAVAMEPKSFSNFSTVCGSRPERSCILLTSRRINFATDPLLN